MHVQCMAMVNSFSTFVLWRVFNQFCVCVYMCSCVYVCLYIQYMIVWIVHRCFLQKLRLGWKRKWLKINYFYFYKYSTILLPCSTFKRKSVQIEVAQSSARSVNRRLQSIDTALEDTWLMAYIKVSRHSTGRHTAHGLWLTSKTVGTKWKTHDSTRFMSYDIINTAYKKTAWGMRHSV